MSTQKEIYLGKSLAASSQESVAALLAFSFPWEECYLVYFYGSKVGSVASSSSSCLPVINVPEEKTSFGYQCTCVHTEESIKCKLVANIQLLGDQSEKCPFKCYQRCSIYWLSKAWHRRLLCLICKPPYKDEKSHFTTSICHHCLLKKSVLPTASNWISSSHYY